MQQPVKHQSQFEYSQLDNNTRIFVQENTRCLKSLMKRSARDIVEIGQMLWNVKECLPHGQFGLWLKTEFGWANNTARNFMRVAYRFKTANFADLQIAPSALYLLSAPSTPEVARVEAIDRAKIGEPITHEAAIQIRKKYLQPHSANDLTFPFIPDTLPQNILHSSESHEWYTPKKYVGAVRNVLGKIDLDPASNIYANQVVKAKKFFTKEHNGLHQRWSGSVFLNPPYGINNGESNQAKWSHYLIEQFTEKKVKEAVLLINAVPSSKWFAPLWDFPICFTNHRIRFYNKHVTNNQPTHSNAFVYMGDNVDKFVTVFSEFGTVAKKIS